MRLYAPKYYNSFTCKAGECRHSCCRAWDIGVDEDTIAKARCGGDALFDELLMYAKEDEDGYYIERCENGSCPFLDSGGLCRLISAKGDEYLPEICRLHPRFYNHVGNRCEVGLGLACEAAAGIVMTAADHLTLVDLGEICEVPTDVPYGYGVREVIFQRLASLSSYDEFISELIKEFGLSAITENQDIIAGIFDGLEYLDQGEGDMIRSAMIGCRTRTNEYQPKFFAYLVYRYLSVAESESEAKAVIGLAIVLSDLFGRIYDRLGGNAVAAVEAARIISSEIEYSPDNINEILFEIGYLLI